MKKILSVIGISFFVVACWALSVTQAMDVPENIKMDSTQKYINEQGLSKKDLAEKNPKFNLYAPVNMPHEKHSDIACTFCHHKWTEVKWENRNDPPKKCTHEGCHDLIAADMDKQSQSSAAYFAYHSMDKGKSCIGCHKKLNDQGKSTGPLSCMECHTKE